MTESAILIVFGLLSLCVFLFETYSFLAAKLPAMAEPFALNEKVYSYAYDMLKQVWLDMLFWPFLLFLTLIYAIAKQLSSERKSSP